MGLEDDVYKKAWSDRMDRRMTGAYIDHKSVLRDILECNNQNVDENIIEEIHQQRVRVKTVPFLHIDNEIIKTLHILRDMNIKIGLISNCAPEEVEGWSKSALANLFDDIIFSCEVKYAKPNPQIYLTGCGNLNVSPQDSIFIGDGGSNELQGATNVGMNAYQATWFQRTHMRGKISGFPLLNNPIDVINLVENQK